MTEANDTPVIDGCWDRRELKDGEARCWQVEPTSVWVQVSVVTESLPFQLEVFSTRTLSNT